MAIRIRFRFKLLNLLLCINVTYNTEYIEKQFTIIKILMVHVVAEVTLSGNC